MAPELFTGEQVPDSLKLTKRFKLLTYHVYGLLHVSAVPLASTMAELPTV